MQTGDLQLGYCTNIHPSAGLGEVMASLERHAVPLKARLSPHAPFGLGLRLSGAESAEVLTGDHLERFRDFLQERGLFVFTINGFPYGPFHGEPVKAEVHAPDWRTEERVAYTLRLTKLLTALLPEGGEGGISTSPLSYKGWIDERDGTTWEVLTTNIVRVVEAMARVRDKNGQKLHLDIEPEPDGLLERSGELAAFFQERLQEGGARELARRLGEPLERARERIAQHVQVCLDTCHVAVAFEEPAEALARYRQVGMGVGKIQVSSALRAKLDGGRAEVGAALAPFADGVYLHQVVQRNRDGSLRQYPDLPEALPHLGDPEASEWRIHFHVPLFVERFGPLGATRGDILKTFDLLRERPFTRQLEIETYTWDVLPPGLKLPLTDSIEREYRWVRDVL